MFLEVAECDMQRRSPADPATRRWYEQMLAPQHDRGTRRLPNVLGAGL